MPTKTTTTWQRSGTTVETELVTDLDEHAGDVDAVTDAMDGAAEDVDDAVRRERRRPQRPRRWSPGFHLGELPDESDRDGDVTDTENDAEPMTTEASTTRNYEPEGDGADDARSRLRPGRRRSRL